MSFASSPQWTDLKRRLRLGRVERYVTLQSLTAVGGALAVIVAIVLDRLCKSKPHA